MDENLHQQISQSFSVLSNPSAHQQFVVDASNFLINFYTQPNSFEILLNYILSVHDQSLQNCAVIGLKACLQQDVNLCQSVEVFNSLLNLSIYPNSNFVRRNAIFYVSEFISPHVLGVVFQFVSIHSSTTNDFELETLMKLLTLIMKVSSVDYIISISDLCMMINSNAFNSTNIDTITSAVIFRLKYATLAGTDDENMFKEYVESSLQILSKIIQNGDAVHADELIDSFSELIKMNSFDCSPFYSLLTQFFSIQDLPINISEQLLFLSDNIMETRQDALQEIPVLLNILSFYVIHSQRTYLPSIPYELSNHLTFYGFFRWLYDDDIISNVFQNVLPPLFNSSSSGRFASLLILESSFENFSDFFMDKITDIYNFLTNFLQDQDFCVRSTASHVMSQFCQIFKPTTVNFEPSITCLINCLMANQSIEFLTALSEIFNIMHQTDTVFDHCCSFLFQLLNTNDILFQQKVIICISSLAKRSRHRVSMFFDQIFPMISRVLTLNEESLTSPAIACLSHMCESCTQQMSAFAPTFLQIIISNFDNLNTQFDCINGFSTLCEVYTNECQQYVVAFLPKLFEVAKNDINIDDNQNFNDFADDNKDVDDFDEEFGFQNSICANSAAVRVICQIFSIYPQLLVQHFDDLFEILEKYKDYMSGDGTLACAKGTVYISEALADLSSAQPQVQKIIDNIIISLINGSDAETVGNAFLALSILVKNYDVSINPKIFEYADLALSGNLFFQRGRLTYNKCLFDGILRFLTSLIKTKRMNSVYQQQIELILPQIQQLLQSQNSCFRDFALEMFGVYCTENLICSEIKNRIFQTALTVTSGYASIDCINRYAKSSPELVVNAIPQILEIINICFSEGDQIVIEKCIALCGTLLRKYQTDISVFAHIILNSTPPSILVKETNEFAQLLQWIASLQNGELNPQIAAAAIKLLSEPEKMLNKRRLSSDSLNSLKNVICAVMPTIPNFNDFLSEICNGDSFKLSNFQSRVQ